MNIPLDSTSAVEDVAPSETLLERLREAANAQSLLDVANFRFIGLDDIRLAYGESWPAHRKKILEISREFLASRISAQDILIPGGVGFIVVFARTDGASTAEHAKQLSSKLNEALLAELKDPLGPTSDVETHEVFIDDFVGVVEEPPQKLKPEDKVALGRDESTMDWRFRPIWNVKREAVSGYYISPFTRVTNTQVPGYLNDKTIYSQNFYAKLDEDSLVQSEKALKDMFASGRRALLGVPIHVNTLANTEARTRLLQILSRFDKELMKYRIVKISSVPPGFPTLYLEEIVRFMKPIAPNISISVSSEETDFSPIMKMGVQAVGISLNPSMSMNPSSIQINLLFERIKVVVSMCRAKKMLTYLEGPFPARLAMRMCALGVDLLSSTEIWPAAEEPEGMMTWPADNLMKMGSAA